MRRAAARVPVLGPLARLLRRLRRCEAGLSAVEFGLLIPILGLMVLGTVEFGRMIILAQKLQNGTFVLADLAARDETLSVEQLDNMFLAVNNIMQPFAAGAAGTAIVTSVSINVAGDAVVNWQRRGFGTLPATSEIGAAAGGAASLPAGLPLAIGETVIVSEVFYAYSPVFDIIVPQQTLRRVAFAKPRLGTLDTLAP